MKIVQKPLVDSQKLLLPPLHVKLGIVKSFVKAMDTYKVFCKTIFFSFLKLSQKLYKVSKKQNNQWILRSKTHQNHLLLSVEKNFYTFLSCDNYSGNDISYSMNT